MEEKEKLKKVRPNEKPERNLNLWNYHLSHPNTGYVKLGKIFRHKNDKGEVVPLHPSTVRNILKHMAKRYNKVRESNSDSLVEDGNGDKQCEN